MGPGTDPSCHWHDGILRSAAIYNPDSDRVRHPRTDRHTKSACNPDKNPVSNTDSQPDTNEHAPGNPYSNRQLLSDPNSNPSSFICYANSNRDNDSYPHPKCHHHSPPGSNRHQQPSVHPNRNGYHDCYTNRNFNRRE